MKEDGFF